MTFADAAEVHHPVVANAVRDLEGEDVFAEPIDDGEDVTYGAEVLGFDLGPLWQGVGDRPSASKSSDGAHDVMRDVLSPVGQAAKSSRDRQTGYRAQ